MSYNSSNYNRRNHYKFWKPKPKEPCDTERELEKDPQQSLLEQEQIAQKKAELEEWDQREPENDSHLDWLEQSPEKPKKVEVPKKSILEQWDEQGVYYEQSFYPDYISPPVEILDSILTPKHMIQPTAKIPYPFRKKIDNGTIITPDCNDCYAFYISEYYPFWIKDEFGEKEKNNKFDDFSGKILDLKKGDSTAISYFCNVLNPIIRGDFAIMVIPSHDPEKKESGMSWLAGTLCCVNSSLLDYSEFLFRSQYVPSRHKGGDRSVDSQFTSLGLKNPKSLKGKNILLMDDVTTGGNSLIAARKKIYSNTEVKRVITIVLGKTTH